MSKAWRTPTPGGTRAWRKKREQILARDSWLCQLKLPDVCKYRADCVHHTLGRTVSGDDEAHLVAACTPCNLKIGDPRKLDPEPLRRYSW